MIRINSKTLLVYAITVFAFVVFFFVTNQQKPKDEEVMMMNSIKEIQKVLQDQGLIKQTHQKTSNKREETDHVRIKKNVKEDSPKNDTPKEETGKLKNDEEDHTRINQENSFVSSSIKMTRNKNKDFPIKEKVSNFTRLVRQQMASMNKTIRGLPQWKDREQLNRKLVEIHSSTHPSPYVTDDNIILDCKTEYDVIILATSHAGNFERRAWIRETWGASKTWLTKKKWKLVFNVGTHEDPVVRAKVRTESKQFKDVLLLDIPENFYKLPHRVMAGLQWAYQRSEFKYILKTDDDVFIHVDRVLARLITDEWSHEHFIGRAQFNAAVMRSGKYRVSREEWPGETFPFGFCSGGGYFLSNTIIGKMIPFYDWVNPFKLDDVYIALLVNLAGGYPFHTPAEIFMTNGWCKYNDRFLVSHPVKRADCRDFLMSKALIELGKVKEQGHKYENVTLRQYNEMIKQREKKL